MMARRAVCFLLLSLLAVSAFAADKTLPSFAKWLSKSDTGKIAGYSEKEGEYESYYTESQQICLRDALHKNCRWADSGDLSDGFFTSDTVCCGHDDYGTGGDHVIDAKSISPSVAASCDITSVTFWKKPISVVLDTTWKVGTAKISCTFKEPAEKCTGFNCAGTTITVDATVFNTWAYSHKIGYPLSHDESCGGSKERLASKAPVMQAIAAAKAKTPAKAQYSGDYHAEPIYLGSAIVYTGPITSVNGEKEHKWVGGWFEQVTDYYADKVDNKGDKPHAPWIEPNTYNIELVKGKGSY